MGISHAFLAMNRLYFESKFWQKDYPKIQLVIIEGLLNRIQRIDVPSQINPFTMAARESAAHKH
jgi:hypothetical protein